MACTHLLIALPFLGMVPNSIGKQKALFNTRICKTKKTIAAFKSGNRLIPTTYTVLSDSPNDSRPTIQFVAAAFEPHTYSRNRPREVSVYMATVPGSETSEDKKPLVSKKRKIDSVSHEATEPPYTSRHPRLWFDDGHVTVVTSDGMGFKLHSGIMTLHSEVFKERLLHPTPAQPGSGSSSANRPGTCHLQEFILNLPEKGEELGELFDILYNGGNNPYYDRRTAVPFRRLYRILRLGVEYKIQPIIDAGFTRLEDVFTPNIDQWLRHCDFEEWHQEKFDGITDIRSEDAVAVVSLMRAANCTKGLPVALYVCACLDPAYLLDGVAYGSDAIKLDVPDLKLCLSNNRKLIAKEQELRHVFFGEAFRGPASHCSSRTSGGSCPQAHREMALKLLSFDVPGVVFCQWDHMLRTVEENLPQKRCNKCRQHILKEIRKRMLSAWENLGNMFNVPDWKPSNNDEEDNSD
ncbi:hypothetical protein BDY19DRAFT_991575 [Irpex rosettiformis]|uniref:Uncharacterized protein n=1 Tax=Irpex rosettiformis TaxID=378272 RepID=A0ACB8U9N7_9APHY|nr:hypothetical protein BDY19DRAFT_991575 [Irpex rosettiformis]